MYILYTILSVNVLATYSHVIYIALYYDYTGVINLVCTSNSLKSHHQHSKQTTILPKDILDDIPDELIDISHALLCQMKIYFTAEAYQLLINKGMDGWIQSHT